MPVKPSEAEVLYALEEAAQQYAEYMRLADLVDYSDAANLRYPTYSWNNPIGLILTDD